MPTKLTRRRLGLAILTAAVLMTPALGCRRKRSLKGNPSDVEMVWLSDYPGEMLVLVGGKALFRKNQPLRKSEVKRLAGQLGLEVGDPLGDLQRDDLPDGSTTWKYRNGTKIEFLFDGQARPIRMVPHLIKDPEYYRYCMKVAPEGN
jgi:hypothetical protein